MSSTVLGPTEISIPGLNIQEPVFRVRVTLPSDDIEAYGETVPLQPGMLLTADVVFDRRSLIDGCSILCSQLGGGHERARATQSSRAGGACRWCWPARRPNAGSPASPWSRASTVTTSTSTACASALRCRCRACRCAA